MKTKKEQLAKKLCINLPLWEKQSDANINRIAELTLRAILMNNKKPTSLIEFEDKAHKDLRKMGILSNKEANVIVSRMEKTELFRNAVDDFIDDKTLITKLGEGLDAEKVIATKHGTIETPDYPTRLSYIDRVVKLKGIDMKQEDETSQNFVTNINVIAPTN